MKKQWLKLWFNPFERIAGFRALLWGYRVNFNAPVFPFSMALPRFTTFRSGSQPGMVVLCRGTYHGMVDSCHLVLSGRITVFPFPNPLD